MHSFSSYGQKITPDVSARVDTSNVEVNKIYHLYSDYINSRPDSSYANPYWNTKEFSYYLIKDNNYPIDRSANIMFGNYFKQFMKFYEPMVLQIDSLDQNLYQVKTIFKSNKPEADSSGESVAYLTNLYARRNEKGIFKLENTITERTKNWKVEKYNFITYIIHPDCKFDVNEAKNAVDFCEKIAKIFNIKIKPFKYYLLPNTDELGKIYNFDYWTYYIGGQTNLPLRELFTTYGNTNYPHELVHMMFPLKEDSLDFTPKIISEGIATWQGGPKYNISFNQALTDVSKALKKIKNPTYDEIKSSQIRNKFDSNILYVTGAVICKLAFEKKGSNAIWALYNSDEKSLDSVLERIFEEPIKDIKINMVQYILDQTE